MVPGVDPVFVELERLDGGSEMSGRLNVLVVDDQESMLRCLRRSLSAKHRVQIAKGPEQALSLIRNSAIDVAIVDYEMPEPVGLDLLASIQALAPQARRVLMSGDESLRLSTLPAFVDGFLRKPFSNGDLLAALERRTV